jgi:hypothetical protein
LPKIIFQKSGVELNWDGSEENILGFAKMNDLDYGCRMGNCIACQHQTVSGEVEYPMGHTGEPEESHARLCCCQLAMGRNKNSPQTLSKRGPKRPWRAKRSAAMRFIPTSTSCAKSFKNAAARCLFNSKPIRKLHSKKPHAD